VELNTDHADTVAKICRRLDGLPLAIELAAARVKVLTVGDLLARLEKRLPVLTGGPRDAPCRLQTMRDAIGWSHDLLTADEQAVFRQLSVFVGGFTLEAADEVARLEPMSADGESRLSPASEPPLGTLDIVASLVDQSLLQAISDKTGGQRFAMLETIREYGLERIAATGDEEPTRQRHAGWCLGLAEQMEPQMYGGPDLMRSLARLEVEHANLRAALTWLDKSGEATRALRLATALQRFWLLRGHFGEGQAWLERMLARAQHAPRPLLAKALTSLSLLALPQQAEDTTHQALDQAAALVEDTTDLEGLAFVRVSQAWIALRQRDLATAISGAAEAKALYRRLGRHRELLLASQCLARATLVQGDLTRANDLYTELLATTQESGDDYGLASAQLGLGLVRVGQGDHAQALVLFGSALRGYHALGTRMWVAACMEAIAAEIGALGKPEHAAHLLGAATSLRAETSLPTWFADRSTAEKTADAARSSLGEAAFTAARSAGAVATLDETVAIVEEITQSVADSEPADSGPTALSGLSPREIDVLRLLAEGRTDREIGSILSVSRRTVHTHVASILNKFGVENRAAAAAQAVRLGLV
jgi:non-specific serine/threonine protein kinase